MANFTPSNLVAGQALFNDKFKSGEWRMPDTAALKTATLGEVANPMLAELRKREDRTVYAYFPIRQAATNGTARAAAHTGARGDSVQETISWTTLSEPFSISLKQADNNNFSFEQIYAAGLRNAVFNLLNRMDAYFVTSLIADKTQYSVGGGYGAFAATPDDYQLAATYKANFYQNVKAMMEKNLFRGNLIGIVDSTAYVLAQEKAAQGANNGVNTAFQFMGFDAIVPTTRTILDVPTTYTESGLFFETGLVGVIPWIPKQNRKGLNPQLALSYNGDYGMFQVPEMPGIDFAIHSYAQRADNGATNGYTQDLTIELEVSVDLGYVSAPCSTFRGAGDSVVYSAGVLPAV